MGMKQPGWGAREEPRKERARKIPATQVQRGAQTHQTPPTPCHFRVTPIASQESTSVLALIESAKAHRKGGAHAPRESQSGELSVAVVTYFFENRKPKPKFSI